MRETGAANGAYPLPLCGGQGYAQLLHHIHHLILERFNDSAKRGVYSLQEFFVLAGKALGFIFVKPFYTADLFQQMDAIGVGSLGIVLLTGFFTGMVLALQ